MFRFTEREKKQYVECGGSGPHVTKNGSRWLVVGYHSYVQIADGTFRCEKCYRPPIPKAPDYDKPCGVFLLSDADRTRLRTSLAALRGTAAALEARTLALEKEQAEKQLWKKKQHRRK